jgi:hypothetical protein
MPGSFTKAEMSHMHRVVRPEEMPSLGYEWDALKWLTLWDWNDPASTCTAYDDLDPIGQNQHLSP